MRELLQRSHIFGNTNEEQRTRISDPSFYAIIQFSPMSGSFAKFVRHECTRPAFLKGALTDRVLFDPDALARRHIIKLFKIIEILDRIFNGERLDQVFQAIMQGFPASNDCSNRNGGVRVKSFEILQITVEKGILVIPFNLQRDGISGESLHMIHFMRSGFPHLSVYLFDDFKRVLEPSFARQRLSQSLRALTLPTAPVNKFFYRNFEVHENLLEFFDCTRHVVRKDRLRMMQRKHLKSFRFQFFEHE